MAKGWSVVPTVNDVTKVTKTNEYKESNDFHRLMSKTPQRDEEKLKEHNEESFTKQEFEDNKLLDAFAIKKLKSKAAIKRARALAKRKSDAGKKNDKAANPQVNPTAEAQPGAEG